MIADLNTYRARVRDHLTKELLPWWREKDVWIARDAFYGWLDEQGNPSSGEDALWHSVLFSRLLWTFSAAARFTGDSGWQGDAARAYRLYHSHFKDKQHGGAYWSVSPDGDVLDDRKQTYGQVFWVYALSEYHLATGDAQALAEAQAIFDILLDRVHDHELGGPVEVRNRDWSERAEGSLALGEPNAAKSMNTHLHTLEAYTNLLRCVRTPATEGAVREMILAFRDHVTNPEGFFYQFLDMDYTPRPGLASYGHDIEGSWLIWEAAEVLGDRALQDSVRPLCVALCERPFRLGIDPDGGIIDEGDYDGQPIHTNKVWWSQAEAAVGQLNAYQLTGDEKYLHGSMKTWNFIEERIIDHVHGEWFWGVLRDGSRGHSAEKAGPWKCPYHNARACMEIARRIEEIERGGHHQ